jgi:hypothetical protein
MGFYQEEYFDQFLGQLVTEEQAACNANDLATSQDSRRHVAIRKRAGGAISDDLVVAG